MKWRTSLVLAALMFAVTLMLIATPALAQLPEGVSVKVLAEFPSPLPGIEKVRLLRVRMEPGAKWEGFVQKNTSY